MSERYGLAIGHVLHATDFDAGSTVAFAHALRLACATQSSLSILHVERTADRQPDWSRFPAVRDTLARWGLLPPHAARSDVAALGVRIGKASVTVPDPAAGLARAQRAAFAPCEKRPLIRLRHLLPAVAGRRIRPLGRGAQSRGWRPRKSRISGTRISCLSSST